MHKTHIKMARQLSLPGQEKVSFGHVALEPSGRSPALRPNRGKIIGWIGHWLTENVSKYYDSSDEN